MIDKPPPGDIPPAGGRLKGQDKADEAEAVERRQLAVWGAFRIFPLKKKTASLALAFRKDIFKMYVHNDIWDVTCVVPKNEYNIYYFPLRVLNLIQASNSV